MRRWISWIGFIFICGCTVGPKYQTPDQAINDPWPKTDSLSPITIDSPIVAWWSLFHDPLLDEIIQQAATHNKQLAEAEANILQARAIRDVVASKLFPQITSDLSAIRTYFSKNGPAFALSPGGGQGGGVSSQTTGLPFSIQIPQTQNLYTALFDASWEIDLFGKTRRAVEAAEARVGSAIELRNDTLISILAETARTYIELRSLQEQLDDLNENVHLLEQNLTIVQQQRQYGLVDQINLDTAQVLLDRGRAQVPEVVARIYQSIYILSNLTGQEPEALVDTLLPKAPLPLPPDVVAVGLRSDLLRRRPDVRQAERELAAATADVGVAVANFYPTFSLLGDGGLQSLKIKNLFQSNSKTWAFGGDLNVPIYEGGKLVGNLHAIRAAETVAFNAYQQTVLSALQDTESALVLYAEDTHTVAEQQKSYETTGAIVTITKEQFQKGLINQINLITSQRTLIEAHLLLLKANTASLIDLVALYKALGGGWQTEEPCTKP